MVINAPGSWYDSKVAVPIYHRLLDDMPDPWYIIADTAFPCGNQQVQQKIKAPLKSGVQVSRECLQDILRLNRQLLSYRQSVEWGMRALQGAFGHLWVPLDANDKKRRSRILRLAFCLHNVRTRRVGVNQI
jgi:hypothetical protein